MAEPAFRPVFERNPAVSLLPEPSIPAALEFRADLALNLHGARASMRLTIRLTMASLVCRLFAPSFVLRVQRQDSARAGDLRRRATRLNEQLTRSERPLLPESTPSLPLPSDTSTLTREQAAERRIIRMENRQGIVRTTMREYDQYSAITIAPRTASIRPVAVLQHSRLLRSGEVHAARRKEIVMRPKPTKGVDSDRCWS